MRKIAALLALALLPGSVAVASTQVERIQARGELVVVTRGGASTYYPGPHGKMGLEYDLAERFAKRLGVALKIIVVDRVEDALALVASGEADLAAAGVAVTRKRRQLVRFGPAYQYVSQQVVYRRGGRRPRGPGDLTRGHVEVAANTSHAERLESLNTHYPNLSWRGNQELGTNELMYLVSRKWIDYTVAHSHEVALSRRYYPGLRVAFDLGGRQPLAWALPANGDGSLYRETVRFFDALERNGTLAQLHERYYGHVNKVNGYGVRLFRERVRSRLPDYRRLFRSAARRYQLDWRLLAAMGYQESHWNPAARSPTGVRGLMMLTLPTARQLDVRNRLDPRQSIMGGARYFRRIKDTLPARIPEPDRTWMALAAYNVGYGHLEDARRLAEQRSGDPDRWIDVKKALPLLSQRKWYSRTRFGYARGTEPVRYVERIRGYYDLLVWETQRHQAYEVTNRIHTEYFGITAGYPRSLFAVQGLQSTRLANDSM